MQKYLIIIGIVLLTVFRPLAAKPDSLQQLIEHGSKRERIGARLETAFRSRINNFESASYQLHKALAEIQTQKEREEFEAPAYYYLGMTFFYNSQFDSAMHYFKRAMELAEKKNDHRMLGHLYHLMGSATQTYYGDQIKALKYYDMSIYHSMVANNHRALGSVYSDLSNLLRSNGAYERALEYILRARDNYRKAEFLEGEAWVLYLIGIVYNNIGLYEEARGSFLEAEKIYRDLSKNDGIMRGVAITLDQLASVNTKLNNTQRAREYITESLQLHREGSSRFGLSTALKYLADIEFREGNYRGALANLDSSLSLKKEINNITGYASIYKVYGLLFIESGEYQRALDSLQIGLKYAVENNQLEHVMDFNKHLSDIYYRLGEYEQAYHLKSIQIQIADSLYSASATRNLLQLETLLQIEKKEKQIRELEHENQIQDLSLEREKSIRQYLTGIIILSLIMLLMFIYFYREKNRANKVLVESKNHVDEINATKDKFFSIIAHDLRGPFNSILGFAQLLKKNSAKYEKEEMQKIVSLIHDSAYKSYNLLNNLLEWSRTQTGTMPFKPVSLKLNDVLEEALDLLNEQIEHKKVRIVKSAGDITLSADHNMLQTILRNLITNAVKFSYAGGEITIGWERRDKEILISVSDRGVGIAKESQGHLFRIADSYHIDGTEGEKGSGLGLIISKEFVEKHGGSLWVESEKEKGSTFYFTLKQ